MCKRGKVDLRPVTTLELGKNRDINISTARFSRSCNKNDLYHAKLNAIWLIYAEFIRQPVTL